MTQKDVNTAAKAAGAKGIDGGDQEGEALAVAAELNRRGGVLGRKVKIVFKDIASADSSSDANSTGAAVCTYFAQDRRVIGVVNPASSIDVPSFRACMAKARIPLFSASVQAVDDEVAQRLAPFFYQSITPTWNRLAPVLLRRLQAVGWFGGWDPRTGSAAPGTAKVGVLVPDNDVGARVATTVASAFRSAGRPAPVFFRYASATDLSPAVLQFAGNGVTHVIVTDINLVLFQVAANSQGYRPRYGVTTYNGPQVFLETNSPPGQNRGAAGLGWSPSVDVSDANDPGPTGPGERDCLAMLAKGGQTFQGKRLAEAVAFAFCDGIRLLVAGPNASGGLLPDDVFDGVQQVAPSFSPSFGFGNGLGQGRFFIPGFGRDLSYSGDCSCFRYTSRANHSFLV